MKPAEYQRFTEQLMRTLEAKSAGIGIGGVRAPDDRNGVLQDVHWYGGIIGGGFQGYTLGNILSGVFYQKALEAHPAIPNEIAEGEFDTLHTWLKTNIYQHGSKFTAPELIERVTGGPLWIEPYIAATCTECRL